MRCSMAEILRFQILGTFEDSEDIAYVTREFLSSYPEHIRDAIRQEAREYFAHEHPDAISVEECEWSRGEIDG